MPEAPVVVSAPKLVEPADWVMLRALIACVELPTPDVMVKAPIGVVAPMADPNVTDPVPPATVKLNAPSTVFVTLMLPPPALVLSEEVPCKVIGPARDKLALVVVIDPFNRTGLVPVCVKAAPDATLPAIV